MMVADKQRLAYPGSPPGVARVSLRDNECMLENNVIRCKLHRDRQRIAHMTVQNIQTAQSVRIAPESFPHIELGSGRMINLGELNPRDIAQHGTDQIRIGFVDSESGVEVLWSVTLTDYANAVIQTLELKAGCGQTVNRIVFINGDLPGARQVGEVDGSVIVCRDIFLGVEHPLARNRVDASGRVECGLLLNATLGPESPFRCTFGVGVTPPGQLRRGFLYYIEQRRIHPYRQFLHYNNWYDVWLGRPVCQRMTEAECVEAIHYFGQELVEKRGVKMDAVVWDDGWDNYEGSLWDFHENFPNGFQPLIKVAKAYGIDQGVWISPKGGYAYAKHARLQHGKPLGYEANDGGFSMAGPNYFQAYLDVCLRMMREQGVVFFKFDSLGDGGQGTGCEVKLTDDVIATLALIHRLHAENPAVYISATAGTWASPYWLLYADNIWRQGGDTGLYGEGNSRQQWITYRDMFTYNRVVKAGPLYPLNALMLCGVVIGNRPGRQPSKMVLDEKSIPDEIWSFFGSGTCLQELYVSPGVPSEAMLDEMARAAKWARENESVLIDTHWVGGSPEAGNVYGWASWQHGKGILTLRNPSAAEQTFVAQIRDVLELPEGESSPMVTQVVYAGNADDVSAVLEGPMSILLHPFQTLVLEFGKSGAGIVKP